MKIVHVCKMTGVAGTENHLLTLLPGLRARGLDVHLIVLVEPDKPLDAYIARMSALGVPSEAMIIHKDVEYGLIGRLAARFRALKPDAVHTHLIHADWHGVIAARRVGIWRIFWSGHNDDPFRHRWPIRLIQAYLWRRITAGIAISEAVRQFMIKVEFAPPSKVHTIHYGLDPDRAASTDNLPDARSAFRAELGIGPDTVLFGSVCRLIEQKGLPFALQALKQVIGPTPSPDAPHYAIIGEGPLRDSLTAEAKLLGIADHVHFVGWRTNAAALMAGFDVFMMPSIWEGFGLVVIEAMAASRPVIASRVSALPEIVVDGETGYLTPPGDATAIADRMRRLLADPALRATFGKQGHLRLRQEFSPQKMIDRTAALYREK